MVKTSTLGKTCPTRPHWSSAQTVGILSVDNIKTSALARQLLQAKSEGTISHQDAVNTILARAQKLAAG